MFLQEEVTRQELENKAAGAKAAARRKQMLESEKKCIETTPFMELQRETKLFRQDVFKRRHRAKAQSKKSDDKHLRCYKHIMYFFLVSRIAWDK